ncbi:cupin domain-containing protein [Brevundimonas sp.]|uniref:cupin domain-containing protein n=1 Tax=Brevundimonas sp. TaxID=1871086 RepID=UPI002616C528|nr:cupin domain-containing protein [Brevundimonas sp.]
MDRRQFSALLVGGAVGSAGVSAADAREDAGKGFVTAAGEGRFRERTRLFGGTSPNDIKVSGRDTGGRLAVFEYVGHVPGGPPLHVHPDQDEMFYIHGGDYLFQVGTERRRLRAGDTIFLPRGEPHTFAQLSDIGRMLFMFTPAGDMENFFRAMAELAGPPSEAEEAALFAAHGMRRLGPGLDPIEGV